MKKIATDKGYYTPSVGTMPWYIDDLATDVWSTMDIQVVEIMTFSFGM